VAVLSGSLPLGFDASTYGGLVRAAREAGVRCLVDASGELLRQAVDAGPYLIKPNREEAESLTGQIVDGPAAAARTARALAGRGVGVAVISLGGDGAVAAQGDRAWHGWVELPRVSNPVGSGDCLLGGLAVALARGMDLQSALRLGVACGSANALSPETGWVQRADIDSVLPRVQVREAS
jgi:1-phosphofructokinase family hexose kinase